MRKQPNIILLVLDTHCVGRMSIYGYSRETTPVIDGFAHRSTIFDWATSPAQWTIPSHASMFTGLYPTVHQTDQTYTVLPESIPTLAEILSTHGYDTVGFCNNPMVGALENGLRRGFDEFYNYSGTIPDRPVIGRETKRRHQALQAVLRALQKISVSIEREFARSSLLFKLTTMPVFVVLWGHMVNAKGDTNRSLRDAVAYLRHHRVTSPERPLFMFINMMETHLPYYPPRQFIDKWVPYFRRERATREFIRRFNLENYRWAAPVVDPPADWQLRALHDMYDAEIAYQDKQLRILFRYLRRSNELANTLVIVTADHGESHGEHGFMGHNFTAYGELVHVPLIIHYPAHFPVGRRIQQTVSTRRIFHTILEAAGAPFEQFGRPSADYSLARTVEGKDPEDERVVSEAPPPLNIVGLIERNDPQAIEPFQVRAMRRAIYDGNRKLMTVGDQPDELFDVHRDPMETVNLMKPPRSHEDDVLCLQRMLEEFIAVATAQRDSIAAGQQLNLNDDPELLERLRALGYVE